MSSPEYYLIVKDTAEEILSYLAKRPYIEVVNLIKALEKMPPVSSVVQENKPAESAASPEQP